MIVELSPDELKLHPINAKIYGPIDVSDLLESIKKFGILRSLIITKEKTIIDGHRRWTAAKQLGLRTVPCEIREFEDEDSEALAIIEYNRYRIKTPRQIYNEGLVIERIEKKRAKQRQGTRTDIVENFPQCERGRTRDKVGEKLGISGRQYEKIKKIYEAEKEAPDVIKELDKGNISVYKAYKTIQKRKARKKLAESPPEETDELALFKRLGYAPKPWDVWTYVRDEEYGLEYPGSIPAGIVFNTLYFYTEPGDLVVDPMAGGGVVGDVCSVVNRRCLMYDIKPCREDIKKHNLMDGWPEEAKNADLVFLDPPYFKKLEKDYGPESISALSREEYLAFFEKLAEDIMKSGAKRVAFLMSDYTDDEDPKKHIFIWDYVKRFEEAGWVTIRHIMCPLPTRAMHPDFVVKFRELKKLGRLGRSLVIFEREGENGT